ncbi:MAG: 2-amino-4-hydroxy-6-hydroxymethyldihydropteridine diphosphokinase [Candidatus Thiodiazotropha endolucinida]
MSKVQSVIAYIGLGSNLDNPTQQVESALQELTALKHSTLLAHSSLYKTRPIGPQNQPHYINAVASLATTLDAEELLDQLQAIEQTHRRVRGTERWGPRTLDLDLLIFGEATIDTPRLRVPHPEMADRAFVLLPLSEIAPIGMDIPGMGRLQDMLRIQSGEGVERLD